MFKGFFSKSKNFLTKKQEGILSAAALMMAIMLVTKVVGFLRQFYFAHQFGASRELDMFIASNTFPEMIVNLLIMGSVNAALIPVLFESIKNQGEKKSNKLISVILSVFSLALILLSLVAFIFGKQLIGWSVSIANPEIEFTQEQISQMILLLRILLISPAILGLSNLITGVLHVYQRFVIPQLAPFLYNLGSLFGAIIFVPRYGVLGLAYGVILGSVLHLIIQLPLLRFLEIKLRFIIDLKDKYIRKIGVLMLPRVLGLGASQVSLLVDRVIALGLLAGSVSAYSFAESLKVIPASIFGLTFASAAFPVLSKEAAEGKIRAFKNTFVKSINQVVFLSVPVTFMFFVLRVPIVRLVLGMGSGKFNWEDTLTTAWILLYFSIGLIAESLTSLIIKAFYSLQDTRTPVFVSIGSIIFSIITSIGLTNLFSHFVDFNFVNFVQKPQVLFEWLMIRNGNQMPAVGGLALSASLTVTIEAIVLLFILNKKVDGFKKEDLVFPVLKKIFMGVLSAVVMYFVYSIWNNILNTSKTLNVAMLTLSTTLAGFSIYVIFAYIFGCKEVEMMEKFLTIGVDAIKNWRTNLKRVFGESIILEPTDFSWLKKYFH